jgi:hypothetical protein
VEAAHSVFGTFLSCLWSPTRVFLKSVSPTATRSEPVRIKTLVAHIQQTLFDFGELRLVPGVPREIGQMMTSWEPIPGL